EEEHVRTDFQVFDGGDHGPLAGLQDVDGVDGLRLHHPDRAGAGAAEDQTADVDAIVVIDLFGVVDADQRGLGVEDDAGGHDRTGQAAAADLVGSGDGAETKSA